MAIDIKIPEVGESISEVEITAWNKQEGDTVKKDEALVVIESEKASMDVPAPADGRLTKISKGEGETVEVGAVIGQIDPDADSDDDQSDSSEESNQEKPKKKKKTSKKKSKKKDSEEQADDQEKDEQEESAADSPRVMPAARKLLDEHDLQVDDIEATGPGGRLLKEDVLAHLDDEAGDTDADDRESETVRMSPLRRTVARRLVEAQQEMAMLTTFNEIDMSAVKQLRAEVQEQFQEKHDAKLGFMSFFVKAAIEALKAVPGLNGEVRGDDIVYHRFYDIGVAIGGGKGLVVPPLRHAERMSFAEIERTIADLAQRAQSRQLKPEELEGGTFTISNGGIYGSLMSTPIVNPPQTGILGLHTIQDRPVAIDGEIVIRPMMYVALSYDHRIVDGREAVTFLRTVKELIETPAKILLEL